jgi:D-amino-acid oxidase
MRRRTLLQLLGLTAASALARAQVASPRPSPRPRLAPVHVARDRILRTIVGLRPFRKAGYVVKREQVGEQTIVHNYGHGGAGVTLSWGTGKLAVDEVLRTSARKVAVLGCGAVGLATARLLQQRGIETVIYARELPPNTCSDVAGARWYPFDVFDKRTVSPQFLVSLWKASRFAYDVFRKLPAAEYGIRFYPTYACRNTPFPKESLLNFDSPVHDLLPGLRDLLPDEKPFPYPIVRQFETMMIEPAIYLPRVMRDHEKAGGKIVTRDFKNLSDVAQLSERVIVNCTGLGSSALFGDAELYPIKGQLTILKPQPEIDYVTLPPDLYMFPRRDGIVLGGTFQHNIWTMDPDRAAEERILAGHTRFFAALGG